MRIQKDIETDIYNLYKDILELYEESANIIDAIFYLHNNENKYKCLYWFIWNFGEFNSEHQEYFIRKWNKIEGN